MSRTPLALVSIGLLGTACGGSASGGADPPATGEAAALREAMFDAGIPPVRREPRPVSDELFELGQALFFDKILSGNADVSCATCHLPQFATGDGRTLSAGVHGSGLGPDRGGGLMIPRNAPPLFALDLRNSFFWDGRLQKDGSSVTLPPAVSLTAEMRAAFSTRLEGLASQAMLPPVSREEMRGLPGENPLGDQGDGYNSRGGTGDNTVIVWRLLTDRLLGMPRYMDMFRAAYPGLQVNEVEFAHAGNAIAAFEVRAFDRTDSPFDRFMRGDDAALTAQQMRGAREFLRAGCAECHSGPLLSDGLFHNTGLPQLGPGSGLNATPFLGLFEPGGGPDLGREAVTGLLEDRYRFRTASLLNVELTAPYGHAGQFERLDRFVAHYLDVERSNREYDILSNIRDPFLVETLVPNSDEVLASVDPLLRTPNAFDVDAIVAFLRALTADDARSLSDVVPASVPSGLPIF